MQDKILSWLDPYKLEVTPEKNALRISLEHDGNQTHEFLLEENPRPGFLSTISSQEFFNSTKGGIRVFPSPLKPVKSKYDETDAKNNDVLDIYGAFIIGVSQAKAQMYRHLRQVEAEGLSVFRGNDAGVTAAILFLIGLAIAIAGILASSIIWAGCNNDWWPYDDDLCTWGVGLLFALTLVVGGILMVVGGAIYDGGFSIGLGIVGIYR